MWSRDNTREEVQIPGPNSLLRAILALAGLLLLPPALLHGANPPAESASAPELANAAAGHTAEEKSRARAVTVADVFGTVKVTKPGSTVDAPMAVNTPIQQGFQMWTAADSSASVEFEHDSTAILGAHSRVQFEQLELDANGNRLTAIRLKHGLMTLHVLPQRHSVASKSAAAATLANPSPSPRADVYEIKMGDARATTDGKCRFRADVKGGYVRIEVFKGELSFATPTQSIQLGAGKSLEHPVGGTETAFNIQTRIVKDPWDNWAAAEEQKVLSEPNRPGGKERQPQDINSTLALRRMSPNSRDNAGMSPPPPRHD